MVERTGDELWYEYQAEVATPEGFQENPISFEEWLAMKGYCKTELKAER